VLYRAGTAFGFEIPVAADSHSFGASGCRDVRGNVSDMTEQPHIPAPPTAPYKPDMRISQKQIDEFTEMLKKGTQRYKDMLKSVQENRFLSDEDMETRRQNFHDHYSLAPATDEPYHKDGAQKVTINDHPAATYINAADSADAEIRAWHNVNLTEPPDWVLKTSDIQFLQYELAFKPGPITPLRRVVRMNVASGNGSAMVYYVSRLNPEYIGMTLTPDDHRPWQVEGQTRLVTATTTDFFYAFLGTDNAVSSIWLVRDHGRRLGIKGISSVVIENQQNVAICFSPSN